MVATALESRIRTWTVHVRRDMRDTYNLDELGAEVGALSEVQDLGLDGVLGVLQLSAAAYRSVYAPHPHGVSRTWRAQRLLPRRTCQKYRKQAMGRWLARGLGVWATGVSPSTCRACVRLRTEESGWDCGGCCGCQSCSQCALISGRVCWTPGKACLTLIELCTCQLQPVHFATTVTPRDVPLHETCSVSTVFTMVQDGVRYVSGGGRRSPSLPTAASDGTPSAGTSMLRAASVAVRIRSSLSGGAEACVAAPHKVICWVRCASHYTS